GTTPGPQGLAGDPGLPGRKGERGQTGSQGSPGKPGEPRKECGCKELLLRRISIINPNVSHRRHLALHSSASHIQGGNVKQLLPDLESIDNENKPEHQEEQQESALEESSGEEGDDDAEWTTETETEQRAIPGRLRLIDGDDEELLETGSSRGQELESGQEETKQASSITASASRVQAEQEGRTLAKASTEARQCGGSRKGGVGRRNSFEATRANRIEIIVDRVAYSPLAEAKAVISDHRHPLGVRLVNVRPSGLKRVPMSELTEDQDAPPNPRLTRGTKTNSSQRSPETPRRPRADQNMVIDRKTAGMGI
ncbi:hypothetical protein OESDEN_08523, partial [Oesophagostomum dentatum]